MNYERLEEVNKTLRTMDIKGKDYVEVNERIKAFWKLCPNGRIITEILSNENGTVVIQAKVYEDITNDYPRATGVAYEKEGSTFINKTSYIENCETSAVGRALGNAGIGIDTSVASYEEVANAIQQQDADKVINTTMEQSLRELITNLSISNEDVIKALARLNCTKIKELKYSQVQDFRKYLKYLGEE